MNRLLGEKEETTKYTVMASCTFELELPSRVDLNAWDIKVNPGKGWCKIVSKTNGTPKVKPTMSFNVGEKKDLI